MNKKILMGYAFSHIRNLTSLVDVRFYGGATFVIRYKSSFSVSLGSYININDGDPNAKEKNKDFNPKGRYLYMHEYGHYLQSKSYGPSYLFAIGLPSLMSAWKSRYVMQVIINEDEDVSLSTHDLRWYEMNANRRAASYFDMEDKESWLINGYPWEYPQGYKIIYYE